MSQALLREGAVQNHKLCLEQKRKEGINMASTTKHGIELLHDPDLNKSTAFTAAEKQALALVGLVPDVTDTPEVQLRRVKSQLTQKMTALERYIHFLNFLDHNETHFHL